jgi:hypothetical protein
LLISAEQLGEKQDVFNNLSGLHQFDFSLPQGSALSRATLGWKLAHAFGG